MKKFKSLLSILLSIMMIAAMIPFNGVVAFAVEDENKIELKWTAAAEEYPIEYFVDGERIGQFKISADIDLDQAGTPSQLQRLRTRGSLQQRRIRSTTCTEASVQGSDREVSYIFSSLSPFESFAVHSMGQRSV